MNNLVSIIIPTYNRAHLIEETLNSVLKQTYDNYECIIVDDGSEDNTEEILKLFISKFEKFKFFIRPNDKAKGVSTCRNIGIENSNGDYLLFLDSDDILEFNKIKSHIDFFLQNPKVDISISGYRYFEDGNISELKIMGRNYMIHEVIINSYDTDVIELINKRNPMVTSAPMYKREIIQRVGFFNEKLNSLEDWDFHLRCALHNAIFQHIGYLPNSKVLIRLHDVSLMRDKELTEMNKEIFNQIKNSSKLYTDFFGELTAKKKKSKLKVLLKSLYLQFY